MKRALTLALLLVGSLAAPLAAQDAPITSPEQARERRENRGLDESRAGEAEAAARAEDGPSEDAEEAPRTTHAEPAPEAGAIPGEASAAGENAEAESGVELTPGQIIPYSHPFDPEHTSRFLFPPVLIEHRGDVHTTAVFPFYLHRRAPDDSQTLVLNFYHRTGTQLRADVFAPIFWWFRGADFETVIIPPVYFRTHAEGFDFGVAPLLFTGRSGASTYTVIPELLTASFANEDHAYTFSTLFWRVRNHETVNWGLFPLLWGGTSETGSHFVLPPLFFHFEDDEAQSATTVALNFYHHSKGEEVSWGLAPLLFHYHDATSRSWTTPLFHYASGDDGSYRLITPLAGYARSPDSSTLITPVYQRYRGKTELDAAFPLFMSLRDPREQSSLTMVTPLAWFSHHPGSSSQVVAPLFAHIAEEGRFSTTLTLLYWNTENYERDTRASIFFPVFWRFRSGQTVSELTLNAYYHESVHSGAKSWEFHFFPLFAFGQYETGTHWWTVLYGLAEYRNRGIQQSAKIFWIPFDVGSTPPPASSPAESAVLREREIF